VVLNYLMDLDKLVGGSAEMFWQGAFPGFAFKLDAGATAETQDLDDVKDQIFNFIHKFQRWLRLQGIDVQSLAPQVADPGPHVAAQVDMISAATGLPKRILLGSERGELASSEDKDNWADQTKDRQSNICEPVILRPFIDRMMFAGVLPEVEYVIQWPDPSAPDDAARAEVGSKRAMSLAAYVNALGSDRIIPPEAVPEVLLGMTADQAATLTEGIEAADAEEAATEAADKETVEGAGDEPEA
jgi:hypothetical protein